jgi:hypothetical protein
MGAEGSGCRLREAVRGKRFTVVLTTMLQRLRRQWREPRIVGPGSQARLVLVTYMTRAGLGACHLRDPRWCYRGGRLAFVGEHDSGIEIGFDFDQILALETALA